MYRGSSYYPAGVYPAGYPGAYNGSGAIPAGGTVPLTMPGAGAEEGDRAKPAPTVATFRAKQVLGTKITIQNNTQVGTVEDIG